MFTAKKVYAMLENESLWQTAMQCHQLLAAAKIPHAIMGGVAVCLHGYQRNTVDVDLLIRQEDADARARGAGRREVRLERQGEGISSPSGVASGFCLPAIAQARTAKSNFPIQAMRRATTEIEDFRFCRWRN